MASRGLSLAFTVGLIWGSTLSSVTVAANLDQKIGRSKSEILQLGARLNTLEKEIGKQNNLQLKVIDQIKLLESDLVVYKERLEAVRAESQERENEFKQILRTYTLAVTEGEGGSRARYASLIEKNRKLLEERQGQLVMLEKACLDMQTRMQTLEADSSEVQQLVLELEAKKRGLTETYLVKIEERNKLEEKMQEQRLKTKLSAIKRPLNASAATTPPLMKLLSPLERTMNMTSSDKGVTYRYEGVQPLRAPQAGRVIYNGQLASYGNVLMLDHGQEVRSVLLGHFTSQLAKDTKVAAGEIVGHTEQGQAQDSLYFEVRRKNVAQKTIHWLNQAETDKISSI